jgi:hypothetical protein
VTPLEIPAGVEHGGMLDRRDDDVLALSSAVYGHALDGEVVGLAAPRR